jgi:hypothetical protein
MTLGMACLITFSGFAGEVDLDENDAVGSVEEVSSETEESNSDRSGRSSSGLGERVARMMGASSQSSGGGGGSSTSKLQVHGFLTQAYADASFADCPPGLTCGPTESELNLGIPEGGTWDYRSMALQFRYEISPKDVMVVQLSSRLLGNSPVTDLENDIELDWAFYERRLSDDTSLKIGRVQIPLGIYNETRDVGTILPFYRPPFGFYQEGAFTSETVDGIVLSHTFNADGNWSLDANVYLGEWEVLEVDPGLTRAAFARATDAYGVWFWLNTPISGLRFGFGGNDKEFQDGIFTAPDGSREGRLEEFDFSIDATFDRFIFRSEYRILKPEINTPFFTIDLTLETLYGQIGIPINDQFSIWLQGDYQLVESSSAIFTKTNSFTLREDLGISFKYDFTPGLVLKAEYHEVDQAQEVLVPVFGPPTGFALDPTTFSLDGGSYWILSLSVSF